MFGIRFARVAGCLCSGIVSAIAMGQSAPSPENPFVYVREVWATPENPTAGKLPAHDFFQRSPDFSEQLKLPETPQGARPGTNYVQRIRGHIEAPETGAYRFAIASDDASELWLSTDEDPANLRLIASVDGYTAPRAFAGSGANLSRPITLIKGNRYYLEARHCQGTGDGHLSVGWKVPRSGVEQPHLIGQPPQLVYTYEWFQGAADQDPASHPIFGRLPQRTLMRGTFATPADIGSNVATRLSGTVVAPRSGDYVFMVSADDRATLLVAPGGDPAKKTRVAYLDSWVNPGIWQQKPSQVSDPIRLEAGQKVYIELLHVQGGGPGHAAVGWKGPNGLDERPIPSNRSFGGS